MKRRRNKIDGQFAWRLVEMLESPVMRVLNQSEHRLLSVLEIRHAHHGGTCNGALVVTHKEISDYGVDREAVSPSIRCLVALKLIEITKQGRGGNREYREPSQYRLTYRHTDKANPTNEWRSIDTREDALRIATEARKAKDPGAVARSAKAEVARSAKAEVINKPLNKQKTGADAPQVSGRNLRPETQSPPGRNHRPSSPGRNLRPSIYIYGEEQDQSPREARPQGSAEASGAAGNDRDDLVLARVADRLYRQSGGSKWSMVEIMPSADLERLMRLERSGDLRDLDIEEAIMVARRGAA